MREDINIVNPLPSFCIFIEHRNLFVYVKNPVILFISLLETVRFAAICIVYVFIFVSRKTYVHYILQTE